MKFKNLLLIAGLLLASGLQAMQPLAPGLISTDYSDDSGSESDVEDFPRQKTMKKSADQPTTLTKQVVPQPAALLYEKSYDSRPWRGAGVRELSKEQPLEPAIEYADRPRPYPALPKGLFTEVPSKSEPDTRFYKDIRRAFLTPIGTEPRLEKPVGVDPTLADKPYRLDNFAQRNRDIQPIQTVIHPREYDKPGVQRAGLVPFPIEKPIESAIEYTERPRPYPALPKGLFITPPSTKEFDEPLARKKILADEPTLAKQPPVYADKPTVLPTRPADTAPMGILKPVAPIVEPKKPVLPVIIASILQKHAQFEVTITNSTNDVFNVVYNNERQIINPNETATITIDTLQSKTSQVVKTTSSSGVQTSRQVIPITTDSATISLVRKSDQQAFNIILGQRAGPKNMTTAVTLQKDERVSKKTLKQASITSEFARKGFTVYFPINITLKGNDLTESTIQATPTEE